MAEDFSPGHHANFSNCYPEIHPQSSRDRILELQEEIERIYEQIWDETQNAVEATHQCNESAFYRISCSGDRAYRLSLRLSGCLMELSSLGGNLARIVTRARESRNEQRQQQRRR